MGIQTTTRVIRGGRALETVYWHYGQDRLAPRVKVFRHGRTLVFPKKTVPKAPSIAEQVFQKIR